MRSEDVQRLQGKGFSEAGAVHKLVSLKRTKAEKKTDQKVTASPSSSEDYSYNSRLSLDHDMLDKLGMEDLPKVGSEVRLHARAKVRSTSHDVDSDGKARRRVELQLTHMGHSR